MRYAVILGWSQFSKLK